MYKGKFSLIKMFLLIGAFAYSSSFASLSDSNTYIYNSTNQNNKVDMISKTTDSIFSIGGGGGNGGGEPGPWPLGPELPFPWDDIEGIWSGSIDGIEIMFSFEVIENNLGQRQISAKELDPTTGEPIISGVGTETDKVVRAIMTAGRKKKYYLTIRQVKDETCIEDKNVTIVTVQGMSINDFVYLFAIQKISNSPLTQTPKYIYNQSHFRKQNSGLDSSDPFCFFK